MMNAVRSRSKLWSDFFHGKLSLDTALYLTPPVRFRPKITQTKFLGKPFAVPFGDLGIFLSCRDQIVRFNQYHVELIKDDAVVVDAGANTGVFSCFVALKYPRAKIMAFEPSAVVREALIKNAAPYPNITVFPMALGDRNGEAKLVTIPEAPAGNYIGEGGDPVTMATIDSLKVRVDFLKMDTEGYEREILTGARETIKKWKPVIAMSAYHKLDDKVELPKLVNSITPYDCQLYEDAEEDLICTPKEV